MYYYFFTNLLITALVLISLTLLRTSPFRVRFRVVLIAIFSWLLPYDLIQESLKQYQVINLPTSVVEYSDSFRQTIVPQITSINYFSSIILVLYIFTFIGISLFISDLLKLRTKLKRQQNNSIFYQNIDGINCYSVKNLNTAFASGIFKPVIWFDEKYLSHKSLHSLLEHELQHIKQFDHLWLLIITFIQKLLWWNPLVLFLCKKSRALIELSCDQACANTIGKSNYQKHLANLMIQQNYSPSPVLTNNFFGKNKFNIFRIKKLSEDFIMNRKHKSTLLISLVIMLSILLTSLQSVSMQEKEDIDLEDVILTENQVIVETLVTLHTNYKYENIDSLLTAKKVVTYNKMTFETKLVVELGKPFKFSTDDLKGFVFEATATRTSDNNILMQTDVKFISEGKNIHLKPALYVPQPPEFGRIEITGDEGDDYKLVMDFTIHK